MWLLAQLFEIVLVIAGLNILWDIVRAPFIWYTRQAQPKTEPVDVAALQRAANHDYTLKVIRQLPDPTAAATRLGLTL